ncbi:MAG: HipA domain-containing protein [Lachnospira eligens]
MRDVLKIVDKYSSRQGLDMTELYLRIVFSYVVGNSDMHLKNFSLIETEEGSGEYILSPTI